MDAGFIFLFLVRGLQRNVLLFTFLVVAGASGGERVRDMVLLVARQPSSDLL